MAIHPEHESVFRFIALKPAAAAVANPVDIAIADLSPATTFVDALRNAHEQRADQTTIARSYLLQQPGLAPPDREGLHKRLADWVRANGEVPVCDLRAPDLGADADAVETLQAHAADSVLAYAILQSAPEVEPTSILKALHAAWKTMNNMWPAGSLGTLGDFLSRGTVFLPDFVAIGKPLTRAPEPSASQRGPPATESQEDARELDDLETAHTELLRLGSDEKYRWTPSAQAGSISKVKPAKAKGDVAGFVLESRPTISEQQFIVDPKFIAKADERTRRVLKKYGVDEVNPNALLPVIRTEIDSIRMRMEKRASTAPGKAPAMTPVARCMYQVGVGDLLMVKQKLKAYELTEIAHVENVLAGESKDRVHRALTLREEITTELTEFETEKARDLQSTERNETQTEAERRIKEDLKFEAGLQVSGSYGPSISFSASVNASFARTTEDVQRQAVTFSREMTEKVSEKVREKTSLERIRRLRQEIEETNTHQLNNTAGAHGHIRGVYRWLNKIYDAQIFNYGKRMMYEFVVPEPAAFYLFAKAQSVGSQDSLVKPDPPRGPDGPLRPSDITTYNFPRYIAEYRVTNAPVAPPRTITRTFTEKQEGNAAGNYSRATTLSIPDGYMATAANFNYYFDAGGTDPTGVRLTVSVGAAEKTFRFIPPSTLVRDSTGYTRLPQNYEREVSVLVSGHNVQAFAIGIDVFCELTALGTTRWQLAAYEAIVQAYESQLAAYEDRVRARDAQQSSPVQGASPLINRRAEREELKKLSIMMLRNDPALDFDAFQDRLEDEPTIDPAAACAQSSIIRFLENAMEWNNMMYVFYPYFWGRHSKWISALHISHPDPDFEAFLKAGAARVQVPVRPGFEKAMAYFCQTGIPWLGADPPLRRDALYVPIVQEISESLGRIEEGVPYPEGSGPWDVILPTSLVVLQNLEEVSGIKDVLTGRDVALLSR